MEVKTKELLDDNIINVNLERTLGFILGITDLNKSVKIKDINRFNMLMEKIISGYENNKISLIFDENDDSWRSYYNYDEEKKCFYLKEEYKDKFSTYFSKLKRDFVSWTIIKANENEEKIIKILEIIGKKYENEITKNTKQKVLK